LLRRRLYRARHGGQRYSTPLLDTAAKIVGALGVTVGVLAGTEPMPRAKGKGKK